MNKKRFTLIELLVVVAIIAILAGMLLPALGKVKQTAQGAFCANNLKQVAMAFQLYMNDFNDYLIVAINSENNWITAINAGNINPYNTKSAYKGITYLSSAKAEEALCPSRAPFKYTDHRYGYCHRTFTHIPANLRKNVPSAYLASNTDSFYNTRVLKSPSSFFLAGDGWSSVGSTQRTEMTKFSSATPDYTNEKTSNLPFLTAHGSSGNFNFLDGHVQGVRSASEFVSFCKAEQPGTEMTCTVWIKIGAPESVTE